MAAKGAKLEIVMIYFLNKYIQFWTGKLETHVLTYVMLEAKFTYYIFLPICIQVINYNVLTLYYCYVIINDNTQGTVYLYF